MGLIWICSWTGRSWRSRIMFWRMSLQVLMWCVIDWPDLSRIMNISWGMSPMTTFTLDKSSIQWSMITCILETIECAKHKLRSIIHIACTDLSLLYTYYHHMFPKDCRFIITILTTGFRLIRIGDTLEIIVNSFFYFEWY